MSKSARPGPKRRAPNHGASSATSGPALANPAEAAKSDGDADLKPAASVFPAKRRCQGATRYGQPCRLWATAGGDFCYWCERAGRPHYPLAAPAGQNPSPAGKASIRKQRCRGVTVFGESCGYFSAGEDGFCLWCQGADKRSKDM
jgi:hypothetical protein